MNSPVRAFRAVGGQPLIFRSGHQARIVDVDQNEYLDLVGSWGPLILGHNHPAVVSAIAEAVADGITFGASCPRELALAQAIIDAVPGIERVRLVSSGTEATMSAVRLARGYTKRELIIKFSGCYHGHGDCLLVKAGSGSMTLGVPDSAGVPKNIAADTIALPYNSLAAVEAAFLAHPEEIACVIVEPVGGNMGVVPPLPGFLAGLREITARYGAVLIFDEVMTGFRVAWGGAQERYGVRPDLTTLGKIIGGGLPLAAYGGRRELMENVSPLGPVYQAGTLSGNPVCAAAGLATLRELAQHPEYYQQLEALSLRLQNSFRQSIAEYRLAATVQGVGAMLTVFFCDHPVTNFEEAQSCNLASFRAFFSGMLKRGIYLPPSQFEAFFLNTALSAADERQLCTAFHDTVAELARNEEIFPK